ncbi:hypothetical protein [Pendulispora rubella]
MEKKETKKPKKQVEIVRVCEIHVGDVGAASCATICSAVKL